MPLGRASPLGGRALPSVCRPSQGTRSGSNAGETDAAARPRCGAREGRPLGLPDAARTAQPDGSGSSRGRSFAPRSRKESTRSRAKSCGGPLAERECAADHRNGSEPQRDRLITAPANDPSSLERCLQGIPCVVPPTGKSSAGECRRRHRPQARWSLVLRSFARRPGARRRNQ